jgi:hypothetical protein
VEAPGARLAGRPGRAFEPGVLAVRSKLVPEPFRFLRKIDYALHPH